MIFPRPHLFLSLICFSWTSIGVFADLSKEAVRPLASRDSSTDVACNNSPLLCDRTYSNITHLGAHDSAFIRTSSTDPRSIAGDQFFNATEALSAGVRLLQAQVHSENATLQLCHTTCALLDAGPLVTWLTRIREWMDANPNEVVTLLLVNSNSQAPVAFGRAFEQSGLSKYGYSIGSVGSSSSASGWPSLRSMIAANKRLVTFVAPLTADQTYPYLLSEFQYVFETQYFITNLAQFSNCSLDRPASVGSATTALRAGLLGLLNHFAYASLSDSIQIPDVSDIDITNSPDVSGTQFADGNSTAISGTLGTQARLCTNQWGVRPTFILVDFFNRGPAIDTVDALNGLTSTTGRVITAAMQANSTQSGSSDRANPQGWPVWGKILFALLVAVF